MTLTIEKSVLKAWPHKVSIQSPGKEKKQLIYDWLHQFNIKYQYSPDLDVLGNCIWYLKNDEDAIAFVLKWS